MPKYREIADDLRQQIEDGQLPAGSKLPFTHDLMDRYGASKSTVRAAVEVLAKEGLVLVKRRHGTVVRDRRDFHLPVSRYREVLDPTTPGGGPFESACKAQGLNGFMKLVDVDQVPATDDLAALLELDDDSALVCRRRDALIDEQVVQIQHAWYPIDIAEAAGLDRREKVEGGVYRALARAGIPAATASESNQARMPTPEEASHLGIGKAIPVLAVERVTRDAARRPIEVLRVVSAGDRVKTTYDDLPIAREAS